MVESEQDRAAIVSRHTDVKSELFEYIWRQRFNSGSQLQSYTPDAGFVQGIMPHVWVAHKSHVFCAPADPAED